MQILSVAVTAVVVSLDSFMAGFSLSLKKSPSTMLPSAVALITLLMCIATSFLGNVLWQISESFFDIFGAVLLFVLAAISLMRRDETHLVLADVSVAECLTIGFAVGMDAAVANMSFAGGNFAWVTPIVFGVTHYLTVALGQLLAKKVVFRHTNVLAAIILALIALTKLL